MEELYDILIIGGGTAGMTAGIYGARAGRKVMILEAVVPGGQIINAETIENYPGILSVSGADFAFSLYSQAQKAGAQFAFGRVLSVRDSGGIKTAETEGGQYRGRTLIIAAGAKNRPLGLEREKELTGKGVSYCASCDGAFFKGKTVGVVGGGNTALDDALTLSDLCRKVYLIHRRDQFRGEEAKVAAVKRRENVELLTGWTVSALEGEERLSGVTLSPAADKGEEKKLSLDGLFIAVGQIPQNEVFSGLVPLTDAGYIRAGEDCGTGVPGIYAAGDCREKDVRQLSTAAADGTVAAVKAAEYLSGLE